jgi:hypothetical protein
MSPAPAPFVQSGENCQPKFTLKGSRYLNKFTHTYTLIQQEFGEEAAAFGRGAHEPAKSHSRARSAGEVAQMERTDEEVSSVAAWSLGWGKTLHLFTFWPNLWSRIRTPVAESIFLLKHYSFLIIHFWSLFQKIFKKMPVGFFALIFRQKF